MEDRRMTFTDHLAELRSRLLRSVLAIGVAFFAAYAFHVELFRLLAHPVLHSLRDHGVHGLQALQVTETITIYLQTSLVAAIAIAAPYIFYQIWAFVAPGLLERERRFVAPILALVSGFFMLGLVFCYFVFLPMVMDFLVGFTLSSGDVSLVPTVERTFSLITTFMLVFGLVFELPLVLFVLALIGIMPARRIAKFSRYFVVATFVVSAIVTPPDPLSQMLLAVPLTVLYFVGLAFAFVADWIREGTSAKWGGAVVALSFILFATGVIGASWALNRSPDQSANMDAVIPDARWAVTFDSRTELGRFTSARLGLQDTCGDFSGRVIASGRGKRLAVIGADQDSECKDGKIVDDVGCELSKGGVVLWPGPSVEFTGIGGGDNEIEARLSNECAQTLINQGSEATVRFIVKAATVSPGVASVTILIERDQATDKTGPQTGPVIGGNSTIANIVNEHRDGIRIIDDGNVATITAITLVPQAAAILAAVVEAARDECL